MIHTVKGFSVVNEAEVDVFLEFPCFLYDPTNVGNLISGSSAFSKPILFLAYQLTREDSQRRRILYALKPISPLSLARSLVKNTEG